MTIRCLVDPSVAHSAALKLAGQCAMQNLGCTSITAILMFSHEPWCYTVGRPGALQHARPQDHRQARECHGHSTGRAIAVFGLPRWSMRAMSIVTFSSAPGSMKRAITRRWMGRPYAWSLSYSSEEAALYATLCLLHLYAVLI